MALHKSECGSARYASFTFGHILSEDYCSLGKVQRKGIESQQPLAERKPALGHFISREALSARWEGGRKRAQEHGGVSQARSLGPL